MDLKPCMAAWSRHQVPLSGKTLDTRTYDVVGRLATSTYQSFHSTRERDFEERKDHELVFPLAPVLRERGEGHAQRSAHGRERHSQR